MAKSSGSWTFLERGRRESSQVQGMGSGEVVRDWIVPETTEWKSGQIHGSNSGEVERNLIVFRKRAGIESSSGRG